MIVVFHDTAFPLCRAIERHWNKIVLCLVFSVIVVMFLQISYVICIAMSCCVPTVSVAKDRCSIFIVSTLMASEVEPKQNL